MGDWIEFRDLAESHAIGAIPVVAYTFRGQSNDQWGLSPSLHRVLPQPPDPALARSIEDILVDRFRGSAPLHLSPSLVPPNDQSPIAWWPTMQHWGAPTRLLDWTRSPFVAAYFAVNENPNNDGVVWLFRGKSLIEGMSLLHSDYSVRQHLPPAYLDVSAPTDLAMHHAQVQDERMASQQAAFSVSRNVAALPDTVVDEAMSAAGRGGDQQHYRKLVIPQNLKPTFLKRLSDMNITAASLFPDLDGLGKGVRDLATMLVHHHLTVEDLTRLTVLPPSRVRGPEESEEV